MFYQLSILSKSGISIVTSLDIISKQCKNKKLKVVLSKIEEEIIRGNSIYKAFSNRKIFSADIIQSIKVGEESGSIDKVFKNININLESKIKTRKSIFQAITYPILLIIVSYILLNITFIVIFPALSSTIIDKENNLYNLMKFSLYFKEHYILVNFMLILFCCLVLEIYIKVTTKNDKLKIDIPIVGKLILSDIRISIYESLVLLINNGVPIITAIEDISYQCKNNFIKGILKDILKDIRAGKELSIALNKKYIFDDIAMAIITSGIESGYLPESIEKVSEIEKEEFKNRLDRMIKRIGPGMLIILGAIVLFVLVSIMNVMFSYMEGII